MSAVRHGLLAALPLTALLSASCSQSTRVPPPFVFDTPGEVELVCYDTSAPREGRTVDSDARVPLPFACCTPEVQRQEDPALRPAACAGTTPVAHALITQSSDGEVAAVDLSNNKVLDSELRIPGYTFVDVGGLPTAIVVPRSMPSAVGEEAAPGGPLWTYVAGREHNSIRAIPTCRFLLGRPCGPELADGAQTEVFLPEAPQDMVLDPAGGALWVTLPKQGVIARLQLGTSVDLQLLADGAPTPPFALETEEDGTVGLREPAFFQVASGLNLARNPADLAPLKVDASYEAVCGLGFAYDAAAAAQGSPLALPNAEPALSSGRAEPTRIQLLETEPSDGSTPEQLLLVADYGQAVVHSFAIVGDKLESRGAQDVRARLRDFAVTRKVPASAPPVRELKTNGAVYEGSAEDNEYVANTKQYLYGIDEVGGVLAFELSFTGRQPVLELLRAPVPRLDGRAFADRLRINTAQVPARALDIIDTRDRDVGNGSASYCRDSERSLSKELTAARNAAAAAARAYNAALPDELPARAEELALRRAQLAAVERLSEEQDQFGPASLRGVYVAVSASDGLLTLLDVHDLDLQCRVQKSCSPNDFAGLIDASNSAAVAVRRHAPRVGTYTPAAVTVTGSDELAATTCPDGYRQADGVNVCTAIDPWRTRNGSWAVSYEGEVFDVQSAVLEATSESTLTLRAPLGFSFCGRGVMDNQFQVAILSAPSDADPALRCPVPTVDTAQRLVVTEAFDDRLELSLPESPDSSRIALTPEQLAGCYPRFVSARLHLYQAFLVRSATFNRARAGSDGRCVTDESIDPRFTSRGEAGVLFQDPSIAFTIAPPGSGPLTDVNPIITVSAQTSFLVRDNLDSNSGRSDAGPRRVRYFPETGDLFVVDQASQGLKRFSMTPFEADSASIR